MWHICTNTALATWRFSLSLPLLGQVCNTIFHSRHPNYGEMDIGALDVEGGEVGSYYEAATDAVSTEFLLEK